MSNQIPKEFFSDETGEAFTHCVMCNIDLTQSNVPYAIEKAMKRLDDGRVVTLFEMAICMNCGQQMHEKLSTSSRKVMEEYFLEIELPQKRMAVVNDETWEDTWKDKCLVTGKSIDSAKEFNLIGNFLNGSMIEQLPPLAINGEVLEVIQEKLSPETREELDDFRDTYLGPSDPQLRALLSETQLIFI